MRPIDADALTDEIRKYANDPVKLRDRRWDARCTAIIADMIGTVKTMPTIGGWISVKDRLPERMERYLVVFYPPATCKQVMEVSLCKDGWYRNRIRIADEYITHWMPLPEPPKEAEV